MALRVNKSDGVLKRARVRILYVHRFLFSVPKELIFLHMADIYTWKTIKVENLIQIIWSDLHVQQKSPVHQISKRKTNLDLALAFDHVDFMCSFLSVHCLYSSCPQQGYLTTLVPVSRIVIAYLDFERVMMYDFPSTLALFTTWYAQYQDSLPVS